MILDNVSWRVPPIWITSPLLFFYYLWPELGMDELSFGWITAIHTLLAFVLASFLTAQVDLITTVPTLTSQLPAMITGWEEVKVTEEDGGETT